MRGVIWFQLETEKMSHGLLHIQHFHFFKMHQKVSEKKYFFEKQILQIAPRLPRTAADRKVNRPDTIRHASRDLNKICQ